MIRRLWSYSTNPKPETGIFFILPPHPRSLSSQRRKFTFSITLLVIKIQLRNLTNYKLKKKTQNLILLNIHSHLYVVTCGLWCVVRRPWSFPTNHSQLFLPGSVVRGLSTPPFLCTTHNKHLQSSQGQTAVCSLFHFLLILSGNVHH
jgi:hypothetical protein